MSNLSRHEKLRVQASARAWNESCDPWDRLSRGTMDVLRVLLWEFHNARTGRCFPSYERIAEAAHCARSTVGKALKALRRAGLLAWRHRVKAIGRLILRSSNAYTFRAWAIDHHRSGSDGRTGTFGQGRYTFHQPLRSVAEQLAILRRGE
jgi:hypothetical protein